ncbi:CCA tRNA nucleotidyltransferase [Methylobacterium sp. NFXW15]|uniref:CCA tRNA nucleotidyltransferase n=1 Tax=Methylobacterium sp. NFXW15 TaxID=2819512 RepID=UPI003CEDB51E
MSHQLDRAGPAALLARPGVRATFAALSAPGEETRLVGGCVRDALLGHSAADIDLATTLRPAAVMERARAAGLKAVPTGIEHGTITVVTPQEPLEVTTLREDVETDGRHAVVRFGGDFAQDAARRDFTINALSVGADGIVHDTVGGVDDLQAGHVRFIGEAAARIREDALRILRFFRFHARFASGEPDAEALTACIAARDALDGLSRERVRSELLKLLLAPGCVPVAALLSSIGLLQRIGGGVPELGRLARSAEAGQDAAMRLAALCVHAAHDEPRLRQDLRLANAEAAQLATYARLLAALHDRERIGRGDIRALAALHGGAMVAQSLAILAGEPRPLLADEAQMEADRLASGDNDPLFPLAGSDLIDAGLTPGRHIGQGLAVAKAEWLALGCPMDEVSRNDLLAKAIAAAIG